MYVIGCYAEFFPDTSTFFIKSFLFMMHLLLENLLYDSDILALLINISIKGLLASSIPFSDFSDSVFEKFYIIKLILSDSKAYLNSTLDRLFQWKLGANFVHL